MRFLRAINGAFWTAVIVGLPILAITELLAVSAIVAGAVFAVMAVILFVFGAETDAKMY